MSRRIGLDWIEADWKMTLRTMSAERKQNESKDDKRRAIAHNESGWRLNMLETQPMVDLKKQGNIRTGMYVCRETTCMLTFKDNGGKRGRAQETNI